MKHIVTLVLSALMLCSLANAQSPVTDRELSKVKTFSDVLKLSKKLMKPDQHALLVKATTYDKRNLKKRVRIQKVSAGKYRIEYAGALVNIGPFKFDSKTLTFSGKVNNRNVKFEDTSFASVYQKVSKVYPKTVSANESMRGILSLILPSALAENPKMVTSLPPKMALCENGTQASWSQNICPEDGVLQLVIDSFDLGQASTTLAVKAGMEKSRGCKHAIAELSECNACGDFSDANCIYRTSVQRLEEWVQWDKDHNAGGCKQLPALLRCARSQQAKFDGLSEERRRRWDRTAE